jgi:GH15 family glucan-1,4-alpha-glucosidase
MDAPSDFQPIENYAVIGNMRSLALVSINGAIDFFCFPAFDSPTLFAALLDPEKGGRFCIQPEWVTERTKQLYLPDTNILLTRFLSQDGIAELTDYMPILRSDEANRLIRILHVIQGEIDFKIHCHPRFDYARVPHTVERRDDSILFRPHSQTLPTMLLKSTVPLPIQDDGVTARIRLKAGERAIFVFGEDCGDLQHPLDTSAVDRELHETVSFWRKWIAGSHYTGRWREMVSRSALLLKLLTTQDYGSIVAAPTFGLPETIGGPRNWDYRFTWLRDASFTLYAFMRLGFVDEAQRFQDWLKSRLHYDAEQGPLQVLYGLSGTQEQPEIELTHLRGYRDSRPVRIGNGAWNQLQLDIYGEWMDAVYLANKYGDAISYEGWLSTKRILQWLAENWNRPDEGIWEVRGGRKPFLHSRLMCWVAFDRAIRLADKRSLPGPLRWMRDARNAIADDIHSNFWNDQLQSFVQYQGAQTLDAATLLMPLVRFISPTDPRWLSTLAAIERELAVDTLVYRYKDVDRLDGLEGAEGSFTACSFWYIEALARSHQLEKASLLFEKMLGYANHVGLYAEELGNSGEHLGNFPQALTHLALISAATYLDRELSAKQPPAWR